MIHGVFKGFWQVTVREDWSKEKDVQEQQDGWVGGKAINASCSRSTGRQLRRPPPSACLVSDRTMAADAKSPGGNKNKPTTPTPMGPGPGRAAAPGHSKSIPYQEVIAVTSRRLNWTEDLADSPFRVSIPLFYHGPTASFLLPPTIPL